MKRFHSFPALAAVVSLFIVFAGLTATRAPAESAVLDMAGLKTMLVNLGYGPEERKYGNGEPYYMIQPNVAGHTWKVTARAPKGSPVYIQMQFVKVEKPETIPQEVLLALLRESGKTQRAFFFMASFGAFMLTTNLVNRDLTPADVRTAIDEMTAVAGRTEKYWDPKQWPKQEAETKQ